MNPDACTPLAERPAPIHPALAVGLMAVIGLATAALPDAPVAPAPEPAAAASATPRAPTYAATRGMQPGS